MNILILEDESPAAKRLVKLIKEIRNDAVILTILDTVESSVKWLKEHQAPDLICMDIQLADGSSFEIFKHVTVHSPVIFITAFDEYALWAFKVYSVDYLLKPVKKEELEKAFEKLERMFLSRNPANYTELANQHVKKYPDRWTLKVGSRIISIPAEQVAYFFSKNKMTFLCDLGSKHYPIDLSLDKIEQLCDPSIFFRINRQLLAKFETMEELKILPKSKIAVKMRPASPVESVVSSERSAALKAWLKRN